MGQAYHLKQNIIQFLLFFIILLGYKYYLMFIVYFIIYIYSNGFQKGTVLLSNEIKLYFVNISLAR